MYTTLPSLPEYHTIYTHVGTCNMMMSGKNCMKSNVHVDREGWGLGKGLGDVGGTCTQYI